MLRLDPSIIPDPSNIKRGDCYGLRGSSAPPEVVVLDVVNYPTFEVRAVMFGHLDMLLVADFPLPSEDLARKFGPILRMIRERHHVNLGQLARALGCRTAALSAFELGERFGDPPRLGTSEAGERYRIHRGRFETEHPAAAHVVEVDQAGLVAEVVRVLGLIDGKDQQHDGEALQQALAILKSLAG